MTDPCSRGYTTVGRRCPCEVVLRTRSAAWGRSLQRLRPPTFCSFAERTFQLPYIRDGFGNIICPHPLQRIQRSAINTTVDITARIYNGQRLSASVYSLPPDSPLGKIQWCLGTWFYLVGLGDLGIVRYLSANDLKMKCNLGWRWGKSPF